MPGRNARRSAIAIAAVALSGLPVWAKAAAMPAPNFVALDWTKPKTTPVKPGRYRLSITLLDAASAVRTGETVHFDTLTIWRDQGGHSASGLTGDIDGQEASCAWNTMHLVSKDTGAPTGQDVFLEQGDGYAGVVEKLCAETPPVAAEGLPSVAAALALWAGKFGPDMPNTPVTAYEPPPPVAPWMNGAAAHRFTQVTMDKATGNRLFLDRANLVRDGQSVTGLSLAILGPQAQRLNYPSARVVALRKIRYDCAARTATMLAQATWGKGAGLKSQSELPFAPRPASLSPVIAAEIDAACTGQAAAESGQFFITVEDAWTFVQAQ